MTFLKPVRRSLVSALIIGGATAPLAASSALAQDVGRSNSEICSLIQVPGLGVALGDPIEKVKQTYETRAEPQPFNSPSTKNGWSIRLTTKGIWLFSDQARRIINIRLDPPFGGEVGGIRLKDSLDKLKQAYGAPMRQWSFGANEAYLYPLDDVTLARFDVNKNNEIATIFLMASIPLCVPSVRNSEPRMQEVREEIHELTD